MVQLPIRSPVTVRVAALMRNGVPTGIAPIELRTIRSSPTMVRAASACLLTADAVDSPPYRLKERRGSSRLCEFDERPGVGEAVTNSAT